MTLDWTQIVDCMYPGDDEPLHEIEPIVSAVSAAWTRWGENDFRQGALYGLEERLELGIPSFGARTQVVVIDQWWQGKLFGTKVVDWKLRTKGMNDAWLGRLERSDQGLWYVHALVASKAITITPTEPVVVEFRGVPSKGGACKIVQQSITAEALHEFDQQREWWERRFSMDHEGGYVRPWGRDRSGCLKYGPLYPCVFRDFCFTGKPLPDVPADFPIVSNASFSSTGEYQRCPERARLLTIEKNLGIVGIQDDGESASMGQAFHLGIACCYEQAREQLEK